jgi:hypothetical protein
MRFYRFYIDESSELKKISKMSIAAIYNNVIFIYKFL